MEKKNINLADCAWQIADYYEDDSYVFYGIAGSQEEAYKIQEKKGGVVSIVSNPVIISFLKKISDILKKDENDESGIRHMTSVIKAGE